MKQVKNNLTIFCSSKENLNNIYYSSVENIIKKINPNEFNIVYGGGNSGIMGIVRNTWISLGGTIISSNIDKFIDNKIKDDYIFDNIIDRQKKLVELGDAYLILPGGYGTHYEMLEVITKNDINEAAKPVFIYNINGIFDNFIIQIEILIKEGFITRDLKKLNVFIECDECKLLEIINNYFN